MRPFLLVLPILILLIAADDGCTQSPPPGVILEVRFEGDSINVLRAVPANRAPHAREIRKPRIRPAKWPGFPVGASEYLVAYYDSLGNPVGKPLAIDGPSHVFFDRATSSGLEGTRARPKRALRHIRLPMRQAAHSLAFFHVQVSSRVTLGDPFSHGKLSPDGSRALNATLLGQTHLPFRKGLGPPPPAPPLPPLHPLPGIKLPKDIHAIDDVFNRRPLRQPVSSTSFDNAEEEAEVLHKYSLCEGEKEETATRYDIVILGDGFADTEVDDAAYNLHAASLCARIQSTPPFSFAHKQGQLNIHIIRTMSEESGITDCSVYAAKLATGMLRCEIVQDEDFEFPVETYFDSYGFAPDPTIPGQMTSFTFVDVDPSQILAATSWTLPIDEIELYVVIANCNAGGGSSPGPGIAVVTLAEDNNMQDFLDLAMHEMGHAIANLAEEYTSCMSWQEAFLDSFPNVVHASQAGDIWWALIPDVSLDTDGDLAIQHRYATSTDENGDLIHGCTVSNCGGIHNSTTFTDADNYAGVGLFWGGAFLEIEEDVELDCWTGTGCSQVSHFDRWSEPMAASVFRPAAVCRMRAESYPFCAVCDRAIGEALFHPTPPPVP